VGSNGLNVEWVMEMEIRNGMTLNDTTKETRYA
jgi:hypothetical protein